MNVLHRILKHITQKLKKTNAEKYCSTFKKCLPNPTLFLRNFYLYQCLGLKSVNSDITQYDVEENLAHLMTLARIALDKGETEKAEAILEMGLKICEEYRCYVALPYMYDILASISMATGDYKKAEERLVNVIEKMYQIGVSENNNYIIDFILKLSRIYSSSNQNQLAVIGFKRCLETQQGKICEGDTSTKTGMLYVSVLFWYGMHLIRNGDKKTARSFINSAYEYSIKIKGLSPFQEMVILCSLCDLNMELEEYDIALQNMQSALLLGRGIGSVELPKCYVKLAKIYSKLTAWENAEHSAMEGYRLAKIFSESDTLLEAEKLLQQIHDSKK